MALVLLLAEIERAPTRWASPSSNLRSNGSSHAPGNRKLPMIIQTDVPAILGARRSDAAHGLSGRSSARGRPVSTGPGRGSGSYLDAGRRVSKPVSAILYRLSQRSPRFVTVAALARWIMVIVCMRLHPRCFAPVRLSATAMFFGRRRRHCTVAIAWTLQCSTRSERRSILLFSLYGCSCGMPRGEPRVHHAGTPISWPPYRRLPAAGFAVDRTG